MRSARKLAVARQVHRVELRGERDEVVEIALRHRAQDQHASSPLLADAAQRLLEHREARFELLVGGVDRQQQADLRRLRARR